MVTPGLKYFFGLSLFGLIGAFVYGLSSGDVSGPDYFGFVDRQAIVGLMSLGWKGNVGNGLGFFVLLFLAGTAGFLGCTAAAFRDADVEAVAELDGRSSMPAVQPSTAPSWWPAASGLGLGVLLMGLVLETKAFWVIGVLILSLVAVEWSLTAWSERSTGSTATNRVLRDRVMAPFEIPVLAAIGLVVVALSVSRILLTVSKLGAVVVAGAIAALILGVAVLAVLKPRLGRRKLGAIVGALAMAIIALGVITAAIGPREFEHHGVDDGEEHASEMMADQ